MTHQRPFVHPPQKPVDLVSWWTVGMSRDEESDWFARARVQQDRMSGSREAKQLGIRRSVEELGWKRNGF